MNQAFVTVAVPFDERHESRVNALLDRLGNVAGQGQSASPTRAEVLTRQQLGQLREFVHFLSIVVVPADGGPTSCLIIELCADGEPGGALKKLVDTIPSELHGILAAAGKAPTSHDVGDLFNRLAAHRLELGTGWFACTLGLTFAGTPGMTVRRILDEHRLGTRLRTLLGGAPTPSSAYAKLEFVRAEIFKDASLKWALVSEPVPLLAPAKPRLDLTKSLHAAAWRDFLWPLIPFPLLLGAASFALGSAADRALWHVALVLIAEVVAVGLGLKIGYERLRRQEEEDVPFDAEPDGTPMAEILQRESQPGVVQNHLFAVSRLKPGCIRRTALRGSLWSVGELQRGLSRPGFLNQIGTIHFARWLLLPGTDRLLFFSNYDGSWQSYLEDFIARLRGGLTSIWSNAREFPKTSNLVTGGVADGARFKRWARRQQLPTRFWYTSYPQLTTARIRSNAAIRHGFAAASNEAAAAKWLALFDYAEPETVEKDEVCSLVFGGLKAFHHAHCLILHFISRRKARAWLNAITPELAYGEHSQREARTMVVALTRAGVETLGLDAEAVATFPTAFQQGMSGQRSRALGDGDTRGWWWGGEGSPSVDAALILYTRDPTDLQTQVQRRTDQLEKQFGHTLLRPIALQTLANPNLEPFGFKDGVSQPIMRGSKRWSEPENALHLVEPGELVLGYRDNLGNVAPTPHSQGRDIGRNGTFLVIRQLEQDKKAFYRYIVQQVNRLIGQPSVPNYSRKELRDWIAARMVGRWRDGSSLVRNQHPPASPQALRRGTRATPSSSGLRIRTGCAARWEHRFGERTRARLSIPDRPRRSPSPTATGSCVSAASISRPRRRGGPACSSCASTPTSSASSNSSSRRGCSDPTSTVWTMNSILSSGPAVAAHLPFLRWAGRCG